jgi:hypothetical protein
MLACNCSTRPSIGTSLETKLLLERDVGDFSHIVDLGLDQGLGYSGNGGPEYNVQYSGSYNIWDNFAVGVEVQSGLGQSNSALRWQDQQNYVGPAVYGDLFDAFHYELAYLAGVTSAASSNAVRFLFQYKKQF